MRGKSWSRPKRVRRAVRTSLMRVSCWTLPASMRSRATARLWAYRTRNASAARRTSLLPATGARKAVLGMGGAPSRANPERERRGWFCKADPVARAPGSPGTTGSHLGRLPVAAADVHPAGRQVHRHELEPDVLEVAAVHPVVDQRH